MHLGAQNWPHQGREWLKYCQHVADFLIRFHWLLFPSTETEKEPQVLPLAITRIISSSYRREIVPRCAASLELQMPWAQESRIESGHCTVWEEKKKKKASWGRLGQWWWINYCHSRLQGSPALGRPLFGANWSNTDVSKELTLLTATSLEIEWRTAGQQQGKGMFWWEGVNVYTVDRMWMTLDKHLFYW